MDLIDNDTQCVYHKSSILPEYDELIDLCFHPKVNAWQMFGYVCTMIDSLGGKASSGGLWRDEWGTERQLSGDELARFLLSKGLSFGNLFRLQDVTCAEYRDALKGVIFSSPSE